MDIDLDDWKQNWICFIHLNKNKYTESRFIFLSSFTLFIHFLESEMDLGANDKKE